MCVFVPKEIYYLADSINYFLGYFVAHTGVVRVGSGYQDVFGNTFNYPIYMVWPQYDPNDLCVSLYLNDNKYRADLCYYGFSWVKVLCKKVYL